VSPSLYKGWCICHAIGEYGKPDAYQRITAQPPTNKSGDGQAKTKPIKPALAAHSSPHAQTKDNNAMHCRNTSYKQRADVGMCAKCAKKTKH